MSGKSSANTRYLSLLGWTHEEIGVAPGLVGDALVSAIEDVQRAVLVDVDGVCGPQTYAAALAQRQAKLMVSMPKMAPEAKLEAAGEVALAEATRDWLKTIRDLPAKTDRDHERCRSFIDDLIRTAIGIGWTWEEPYIANTRGAGNFEWCGTFAAKGWGAAGMKLAIRKSYLPSTYRLDRYARYRPIDDTTPNPRPSEGPHRMIIELDEHSIPSDMRFADGSTPRPGDIALVGGVNTGPGKHIAMIRRYTPGDWSIETIEGNGTGMGPHGHPMHGVVRGRYPIGREGRGAHDYFVRRVIRPGIADLV